MRPEEEYAEEDLLAIYRGAMAEQFVGQEMMVTQGGGGLLLGAAGAWQLGRGGLSRCRQWRDSPRRGEERSGWKAAQPPPAFAVISEVRHGSCLLDRPLC
jgi:hypothetical protein